MSIRRACALLGGGRSTYHYAARRPPQAVLSRRIREIAETRVRYGYRRIHVLLRREGWQVNVKRIYRLDTEEGLQLRHKTPKRRVAAKLREDRSPPAAPNEVWAMDFLSDQPFNGRRIRDFLAPSGPALGAGPSAAVFSRQMAQLAGSRSAIPCLLCRFRRLHGPVLDPQCHFGQDIEVFDDEEHMGEYPLQARVRWLRAR